MRCRGVFLLSLCLGLSACATDPMKAARVAFDQGDYAKARTELSSLLVSDQDNAHLYQMELGVVEQALGDPGAAVQVMRKARDRMDLLSEGNYTDWAAATFLDDRSRSYPGADYEKVVVRAMLALADLMAGGHDAFAYALQVGEKQRQIIAAFEDGEDRPKQAYKLVAFGNYLRAIINEERARGRSEAQREFRKVRELAPQFAYGAADLERVTSGLFAQPGNGVVQLLALVGRGPGRVEVSETATRKAFAVAQGIWAIRNKRPFIPNLVSIPLPALSFYDSNPDSVAVFVNGARVGATATVTDVEAAARAEFEVMKPFVMARAVVRRLVKTLMVEVAKEAVDRKIDYKSERNPHRRQRDRSKTDAIQIGLDLLGILWSATESADLRCWEFLPASFQALRIELPAGEHELVLRAIRGGNLVGTEQRVKVTVFAGANTYVMGMTPSTAGGPTPLTSRGPK